MVHTKQLARLSIGGRASWAELATKSARNPRGAKKSLPTNPKNLVRRLEGRSEITNVFYLGGDIQMPHAIYASLGRSAVY